MERTIPHLKDQCSKQGLCQESCVRPMKDNNKLAILKSAIQSITTKAKRSFHTGRRSTVITCNVHQEPRFHQTNLVCHTRSLRTAPQNASLVQKVLFSGDEQFNLTPMHERAVICEITFNPSLKGSILWLNSQNMTLLASESLDLSRFSWYWLHQAFLVIDYIRHLSAPAEEG